SGSAQCGGGFSIRGGGHDRNWLADNRGGAQNFARLSINNKCKYFRHEWYSLDQVPFGKEVDKFSGSGFTGDLLAGLFRWPFGSRDHHVAHIRGLRSSRQAKFSE